VKVLETDFLRSAASVADLPREAVPQVALVGRSNVGKSSLINALTRSKIARTSAAPGKTRLLNLYLVRLSGLTPGRLYLVDLPGYGYAAGGARAAIAYEALVGEYFAQPPGGLTGEAAGPPAKRPSGIRAGRKSPKDGVGGARSGKDGRFGPTAALLVVDARHPGLAADRDALEWLSAQGRPVVVVASKIDKLARANRSRAEKAWAEALNVPILPVSAVTGEGLEALWKRISKLLNAPSGAIESNEMSAQSGVSAPTARNEPIGRSGSSAATGVTAPRRAAPVRRTTSPSSISRRSRT
jgi:GTP-binding protein